MTTDGELLLPEGSRILHIGPHKTGTSGLQAALDIARRDLDRQGVHYAGYGRQSMMSVLAGLELPSPWSSDRKPPGRWRWHYLLRDVRGSKAARVILSSEFFSDATPASARRILEELDPERVRVVVTLRPIARIIPSQWQQFVQNLVTTPLDAWVEDLVATAHDTKQSLFWHRHRHDLLIRRWAEIVGPERMVAIVVDDRDHEMLLRAFERLTGLETGTLRVASDLANRSLTLAETEVIRAFNVAYLAQKLPRPLYTRVVRFGAASLMETRLPEPDEPRIELPPRSVEKVAELAREMVAGIRASGVRVIGDLEDLTEVPALTERQPGPVSVSPEVAASVALSVLVASGVAQGTGRITVDGADADGTRTRARAPRPVPEPPELFRISTPQLLVTIARRVRGAVADRIAGVLRRRAG